MIAVLVACRALRSASIAPSNPEPPGIWMSRNTTSMDGSANCATASSAFTASPTMVTSAWAESRRRSSWRASRSSSTSSAFMSGFEWERDRGNRFAAGVGQRERRVMVVEKPEPGHRVAQAVPAFVVGVPHRA